MRKSILMNDGWQFALHRGFEPMEKENALETLEFSSVTLPHDWQISSPFNREMEYGTQQGYFDRWGIGWYKKEFVLDTCSETAGIPVEGAKQEKTKSAEASGEGDLSEGVESSDEGDLSESAESSGQGGLSESVKSSGEGSLSDGVAYRLCFDGVYENSTVWVNDILVGGRKYGYSSFSLDITHAVHKGINRILVKVDNTTMPSDRWYAGAGIYRNVYLELLPKTHLERDAIWVNTRFEEVPDVKRNSMGLDGTLENVSVDCKVSEGMLSEKSVKAIIEIHTGTDLPVRAVLCAPRTGKAACVAEKPEEIEAYTHEKMEGTEVCASETSGSIRIATGVDSGVICLTVPEPILWSAEHPALYDLTLQLLADDCNEMEEEKEKVNVNVNVALDEDYLLKCDSDSPEHRILDELSMKIGLRDVELSADQGLFVNGQSVKLKGVCVHQEAGVFGTAVQPQIWRERLLELKKVGCNALRLAHHLYMPEMLDLCDELGFYVYEECFDKWTGGAYGRYYQTEWERDIDTMVLRDRNHPCILFWGVGNEVENQAYPSMLTMLERHVARIKALDASRPVSVAMNPHFTYPSKEVVDMSQVKDIQQFVDESKEGEITDIDDRVRQIGEIAKRVDFLSCNYQEQWYERIHELIPDKAILGTESYMYFRGQGWVMQNYSDENPWWDVEKLDYCIGGMIWTGIDYLGESMGWPSKGWAGSLFTTDMEKRPIAWLHQSHWTAEPMVRFAVMDYTVPSNGTKESWDYPRYETHWDFPQFQGVVLPYMIATNCEQVRLLVNEREFLLKPTAEYPNRVITGYVPYLQGKVTVIGLNGGKEVCRQEIETTSAAVKLRFDEEEQTVSLKRIQPVTQVGDLLVKTSPLEDEPFIERSALRSAPVDAVSSTGNAPEGGDGCMAVPYQMLLKVRALDAENRPVFRESAQVRFTVEGPAEIVGVDNGDILRDEPVVSDRIHLFQGRAAVGLRITGAGRVKVTAYGSGLFSAQTVIVATNSIMALIASE